MEHRDRSLDKLPVKDGFRLRGAEMTRIETFTDAAFAFSLTLMVVSLEIPRSYEELIAALHGIPAFALSAVLLMIFWAGHHGWSRRYGLDDTQTIVLSCLLVFTVLVYVYPLRFLARALTAWMDHVLGLPLTSEPISFSSPAQLNQLFAVYGVGFVIMCLSIVLLNLHAWRQRELLGLNELEIYDTRAEIGAWMILGATGLLSVAMAIATSPSLVGAPGWAYMILPIAMPLYARLVHRRRRAIETGTGTSPAEAVGR